MIDNGGTIDYEGFREDLRNIANNQYPRTALVKLPFNWFEQEQSGLKAHNAQGIRDGTQLVLGNVVVGDQIILFITCLGNGASAATVTATDSLGNSYLFLDQLYQSDSGIQLTVLISTVSIAGPCFVTIASSPSTPILKNAEGIVTAQGTFDFWQGSYSPQTITLSANQIVYAFAGAPIGIPSGGPDPLWTVTGPLEVLDQNIPNPYPWGCCSCWYSTTAGTITFDPVLVGYGGNPIPQYYFIYNLPATPASIYSPPPITSIPLPGPCNFLSLVSECIDESGEYQTSALIGQQQSAGFIRFNGYGNVWFPISFIDPLTPGYATTNDNYSTTPLAGTGFSCIEAAFGVLDWRPASPVAYQGTTPPSSAAGYLLAIVGLNIGLGSGIGLGDGDTYAIPSAAGPVERMKEKGLLP